MRQWVALAAVLAVAASAPASAHGLQASLRVVRVGHTHPSEGAYWNVELWTLRSGLGNVAVSRVRLLVQDEVLLTPQPGRYRLVSFEQHCNGNCERIGPPAGRCERSLRLSPGASVRAAVLASRLGPCTISFQRLR